MPQGKQSELPLRVAAIILAAGSSQRMGTTKALLPIDGEPMVVRVVRGFLDSGVVGQMNVVTGHDAHAIDLALKHLPCRTVQNPIHAEGGMLSSVKAGMAALERSLDAFFVALVDQPMVKPETIAEIASEFMRGDAEIVIPRYEGKRGHPVLFAAKCRVEIIALPSSATLKHIVSADPSRVKVLDVADPAVISDLDTPADYFRAIQK